MNGSTALFLLLIVALAALVLFGWGELQKELDQATQSAKTTDQRLDCLTETLATGQAAEGCPGVAAGGGE